MGEGGLVSGRSWCREGAVGGVVGVGVGWERGVGGRAQGMVETRGGMIGSKNHAAIALTIRAIRAMRQGNIKSGQCPHPVIRSRW